MTNLSKGFISTIALLTTVSCSQGNMSSTPAASFSTPNTGDFVDSNPESEGQPDLGLENIFEHVEEETVSDLRNNRDVETLATYNHLDPKRLIRTSALKAAVLFYEKNKSRVRNHNYITLIDFSKPSSQKRMYVVNLRSGSVWALHSAHGSGSDSNNDGYAERFSNTPGSNASSLGYYMTAETYYGKNGFSLRLDGLSSTNSKARSRAVVVHAASYVQDRTRIQGRSWGCPAVATAYNSQLISMIKGGSLMYAFR